MHAASHTHPHVHAFISAGQLYRFEDGFCEVHRVCATSVTDIRVVTRRRFEKHARHTLLMCHLGLYSVRRVRMCSMSHMKSGCHPSLYETVPNTCIAVIGHITKLSFCATSTVLSMITMGLNNLCTWIYYVDALQNIRFPPVASITTCLGSSSATWLRGDGDCSVAHV